MRLFILSILIVACQNIHCQFDYLVSSNELILGPDAVMELSSPVVDFYYERYTDKYRELDEILNASFGTDKNDEIRQDSENLEEILLLWADAKEGDLTNEFLDQYELGKCYKLISRSGELVTEYDVVQAKDQRTIFLHTLKLKVKVLPEKGYWDKRRKPDCVSTNNPDCYVACYVTEGGEFVIKNGDDELIMAKQASNFEYNKSERILSFSAELHEEQYIMNLETGQKFLISEWEEQECK